MVLIWLFKILGHFLPRNKLRYHMKKTIDATNPMVSEIAVKLFGSICLPTLFGVS